MSLELRALAFAAACTAATVAAVDCSYSTWSWDTRSKRAVEAREVVVARSTLGPGTRDAATGCSVCREDQAWIELAGAPRFQVCRALAPAVRTAFSAALAAGARVDEVVGYRVGATRGPVDARGLRTELSNHSFGIAIDVNQGSNGLYHDCVEFGPACRLVRGGAWRPEEPSGLSRDHPLVLALARAGLRWGGEAPGRQKDFMHFSPTGY